MKVENRRRDVLVKCALLKKKTNTNILLPYLLKNIQLKSDRFRVHLLLCNKLKRFNANVHCGIKKIDMNEKKTREFYLILF